MPVGHPKVASLAAAGRGLQGPRFAPAAPAPVGAGLLTVLAALGFRPHPAAANGAPMQRPTSQPPAPSTTTLLRSVPPGSRPATPAQLTFLGMLAERTGMTYATPATLQEAKAEIRRLRSAERSSPEERQADRDALTQGRAGGSASSVRPDEVQGYGSTARWGTQSTDTPDDDAPRGDERCRALGPDWANPYHQGFRHDGKVVIHTRAQARHAYAHLLWRRIQTEGPEIIDKLAELHDHVPGCCCRIHPCPRDVLVDATQWADAQRRPVHAPA